MLRYYLLATISICLFLKGFFPISNKSTSLNVDNDVISHYSFDSIMVNSTPPVEKMILIIIDALRIDFITPELMPNISAILQNNNSCFNHIKVEMPTVTLPRIKAITTGSIPQFIDIVLNLAHVEALEDSLIHQAYRKRKRIVFYGDDTWLKLFTKKYFARSEGVSSFYVNDFTQVDENVTRNVDNELNNNDWDIMILHYLGLDHIGHVYGPKSNLIPQKLKEMDNVFFKIYKQLVENHENSLILLTGDHGMKDSGGHGGSTYHETNIPLILAGIQCFNGTFEQIDIPVNVAVLLGLDVPKTSIGQIRGTVLLGSFEIEQYLDLLRYNTFKLRQHLDLCYNDFVTAAHLHELFRLNHSLEIGEQAKELYENCSKLISEQLMKSSVNQDFNSLIISLLTISYILLKFTMNSLCNKTQQSKFNDALIFVIVILQFFDFYKNPTFIVIIIVIIIKTLLDFLKKFSSVSLINLNILTLIFIIHPLIFLSSSFIEEEHQFWYFFLGNLIIYQILRDYNNNKFVLSNCLIIIAVRFLRTMNQTGDQWASLPDLSDWLLLPENNHYLQLLFITSLLLIYKSCLFILNKQQDYIISGLILVLIYIFRTIANDDVNLGKILWFLLFLNGVINRNPVQFWLLIISLLLKPYNIILIPFTIFTSTFLNGKFRNSHSILTHLCLANYLFFCQGNGNSLANIDISTGYVGLSDYQPIFVFLQVFSHTYSFPILINLLLLESLRFKQINGLFFVLFYQRIFIIFIVLIVAFIQRQHLFIWSVFAPKIIVETSHFVAVLLQMCCIFIVNSINTLISR